MSKRFLLVVLAACSGAPTTAAQNISSNAASSEAATLSYAWVVQTLLAHPEVKTTGAFLALLPEDYRNRFSLVYASHGAQAPCSALDNPRVIFFGTDASFVIAASNDNGDVACEAQKLELMQFDAQSKSFDLRFIDFGAATPALSETNPAFCTACHGVDPRPIWGSYPVWPGAYGQLDDTMLTRDMLRAGDTLPPEADGYERFMRAQRFNGIYTQLVWSNGRDTVNQGRPKVTPPGFDRNSPYLRPNSFLQDALQALNDQRVVRMTTAVFADPDLKPAHDYLSSECAFNADVASLVSALPLPVEVYFLNGEKPMPKPIPDDMEDGYYANLNAGHYGAYGIFQLLNPYAVTQAQKYEAVLQEIERTLPRSYWGYLQKDDPLNPSNTELPRIPYSVHGEYTLDPVSQGAIVSSFVWLAGLKGITFDQDLFMNGGGFNGTDDPGGTLLQAEPPATTDCPTLLASAVSGLVNFLPADPDVQ